MDVRREMDLLDRLVSRLAAEADAARPPDEEQPEDRPVRPLPAVDRSEIEERAAGRRYRHAYYTIVGDPPQLAPGDREGARAFLRRIEEAIERGGWTRWEWARLYRMRQRWRDRAEGRDPRFELAGTKPGRLPRKIETQIALEREQLDRQAHRLRWRRMHERWLRRRKK